MKALKFIWATSLCVALSMGIISCGHEHEYVDLGLSVKWATCNMGASSPEEYGDYYAWGETETKSTYDWNTYKWCKGSENTLTKYCTDSDYGTVDNKTVLDPEDDVAHVKWGGNWRMPTDAEIEELRENCIWKWTTQNGKNGYKVTSKKNGNSIFLPLRRDTAFTYADLQLNEEQDHRDPSDHVIIAHAITERLTLLSSDQKFAFYRSQGLDLIEY